MSIGLLGRWCWRPISTRLPALRKRSEPVVQSEDVHQQGLSELEDIMRIVSSDGGFNVVSGLVANKPNAMCPI